MEWSQPPPPSAPVPFTAPAYDGIVLAGGGSARMGMDKTRIDVGGRAVLERVLDALTGAGVVVVVGERWDVDAPEVSLRWTCEEPPGGGPAAGVAAASGLVQRPMTIVLAGDLPLVGTETVSRLLSAAGGSDGAVLVDSHGRRQHLVCAVRTDRLQARVAERRWRGVPMQLLLAPLSLAEVPAVGAEAADVDGPEAVETVRHLHARWSAAPGGDR